MNLTTNYRRTGDSLIEELSARLSDGAQVVLLGPGLGAESCAITLLAERGRRMPGAAGRNVMVLTWRESHARAEHAFLRMLAKGLGAPDMVEGSPAGSLADRIAKLLRSALTDRDASVWLLIPDAAGLPDRVGRALLDSLSALRKEGRGRALGAIITGGVELMHRALGSDLPALHGERLVVAGLDEDCTRRFFTQQLCRLRAVPTGGCSVPDRVLRVLYEATQGSSHLLQELAAAPARCTDFHHDAGADVFADPRQTQRLIEHYVSMLMPCDHESAAMLQEAERDRASFDLLKAALSGAAYEPPQGGPQPLEVLGLLAKHSDGTFGFSCPMMRDFVRGAMTPRRVADVYAAQGRWPEAWQSYRAIPERQPRRHGYRSCSPGGTPLDDAVAVWQDHMMAEAHVGLDGVVRHFLNGMRGLFGFTSGGLCTENGESWLPGAVIGAAPTAPPDWLERPRASSPAGRRSGDPLAHRCSIDSEGRVIGRPRPTLLLSSNGHGRDADARERALLLTAVDRFVLAYRFAEQLESDRAVGDLRQRHLQVFETLNAAVLQGPFRLGRVMDAAADALVSQAGYRRVQISLVNAGRTRVQGVASCCRAGDEEFIAPTDFALDDPSADILPWVVLRRRTEVVSSARDWPQTPFRIRQDQAERLGMRAFAVVPITTRDAVVVGTIHFERADGLPPSEDERGLFTILAGYLAGIIVGAERLGSLEAAVDRLDDEVRILDPSLNVTFLNRKAARRDHVHAGWLSTPLPSNWSRHSWAANPLADRNCTEQAVRGTEVSHLLMSREGTEVRAEALRLRRITDFRAKLPEPYRADGTVGLVETVNDLTPLFRIVADLATWVAAETPQLAAQAITESVCRSGYGFCRIYLLDSHPDCGRYLQSFVQTGLKSEANAERFGAGAIVEYEWDVPTPQGWHAILEDSGPTMYRLSHDRRARAPAMRRTVDVDGAPCWLTTGRADRAVLEAEDLEEWIDAPLRVGPHVRGVMTLSKLRHAWSPRDRSLLQILVQFATLSLDVKLEAEGRSTAERETAEAMIWMFHQIRQPLTAAQFQFEGLQSVARDHPGGAEHQALLEQIGESLRAIARIAHDYRRFVRDFQTEPVTEDVVPLLRDVVGRSRTYSATVALTFESDVPTLRTTTCVDEIQSALDELIYNAIRAGSTEVDVRLSPEADASGFCISVDDNGPGVPADVRRRMFVERARSSGGTGYGLLAIHRRLESFGARISCEGRDPRGTRFVITAPTPAPQERKP